MSRHDVTVETDPPSTVRGFRSGTGGVSAGLMRCLGGPFRFPHPFVRAR